MKTTIMFDRTRPHRLNRCRQCIDSHTHKSNFLHHIIHFMYGTVYNLETCSLNLLSIQVQWGWKVFLLSCMNVLCINTQRATYYAPSSHHKHMLDVKWILKGKFIAALTKFQQREVSAAFWIRCSFLDGVNKLNPGLFLDACYIVLIWKELGF